MRGGVPSELASATTAPASFLDGRTTEYCLAAPPIGLSTYLAVKESKRSSCAFQGSFSGIGVFACFVQSSAEKCDRLCLLTVRGLIPKRSQS